MPFHVKDDFSSNDRIFSVPASWFNRVAAFLNTLSVRNGVIKKPVDPNSNDPVELVFPEADQSAEDPGESIITIDQTGNIAGSTTWTAGGSNGCKLKVQTRSRVVSSLNTNFFVWVTLDRYGRIYSVSAEQSRTFIDS